MTKAAHSMIAAIAIRAMPECYFFIDVVDPRAAFHALDAEADASTSPAGETLSGLGLLRRVVLALRSGGGSPQIPRGGKVKRRHYEAALCYWWSEF